jgi:hypothetical protein
MPIRLRCEARRLTVIAPAVRCMESAMMKPRCHEWIQRDLFRQRLGDSVVAAVVDPQHSGIRAWLTLQLVTAVYLVSDTLKSIQGHLTRTL